MEVALNKYHPPSTDLPLTQDIAKWSYQLPRFNRNYEIVYSDGLHQGTFPGESEARKAFDADSATACTIPTENWLARYFRKEMLLKEVKFINDSTVPASAEVYALSPGGDPSDIADWVLVDTFTPTASSTDTVTFSDPIFTRGMMLKNISTTTTYVLKTFEVYIEKVQTEVSSAPDNLNNDHQHGLGATAIEQIYDLGRSVKVDEIRVYGDESSAANYALKTSDDAITWNTETIGTSPEETVIGNSDAELATHDGEANTVNRPGFSMSYGSYVEANPMTIMFKPFNDAGELVSMPNSHSHELNLLLSSTSSVSNKYISVWIARETDDGYQFKGWLMNQQVSLTTNWKLLTINLDTQDITPEDFIVLNANDWGGITLYVRQADGSGSLSSSCVAIGHWDIYQPNTNEVQKFTSWQTSGQFMMKTSVAQENSFQASMNYKAFSYLKADSGFPKTLRYISLSQTARAAEYRSLGAPLAMNVDSDIEYYDENDFHIPGVFTSYGYRIGGVGETQTIYKKNTTGVIQNGYAVKVSPTPEEGSVLAEVSTSPTFSPCARNCQWNDLPNNVCLKNNLNYLKAPAEGYAGCGKGCTIENGADSDGNGLDGSNPPTGGFSEDILEVSTVVSVDEKIPFHFRTRIPSGFPEINRSFSIRTGWKK